jgi:hypothetical protein
MFDIFKTQQAALNLLSFWAENEVFGVPLVEI